MTNTTAMRGMRYRTFGSTGEKVSVIVIGGLAYWLERGG